MYEYAPFFGFGHTLSMQTIDKTPFATRIETKTKRRENTKSDDIRRVTTMIYAQ